MMKHMEGTNIDYDIFDNKEGRGIQIIERGRFGLLRALSTKMLSKKIVFGYAGVRDVRMRKTMLKDALINTRKGTKERSIYKVYMEALGYTEADIKCIWKHLVTPKQI